MLKKRVPNFNSDEITLIFDAGSVSKENLELIPTNYICRFSINSCKELYDELIDENILINDSNIMFKRIDNYGIWGKERTVILTFNQSLFNSESNELDRNISKAIEVIKEIKDKLPKPRSKTSEEYIKNKISNKIKGNVKKIIEINFIIKDKKVCDINYEINDKIKEEIKQKYFGKKLIITNNESWSTAEILQTYYDQDCIESIFKQSKDDDHCSMRPQYHWTDQKVKVHTYCCLLGMTIAGILNKELKNQGIKISTNKMLDCLAGIREGWIKDNNTNKVTKQLEEMDGDQIKLWDAVNKIK